MSLEVTGRLIQVLPEVTGNSARGSWKKQEFVLETAEQYPKKICMSVWGEKVDALKNFHEGDNVKASINLESREYNGRWYTEVRAWRLQSATEGMSQEMPPQNFGAPDPGDFAPNESDDLPF